MQPDLTPQQRERLARLAVTLIPEGAEGPSAAEARVAEEWIDVTLAERPDLRGALLDVLDGYDDSAPRPFLERLQRERPAVFAAVTDLIAASFFRSPAAMAWLGYERMTDEYEGGEPEPTDETERLLAPVRAMAPIYRPTDATRKEA